jgi:hypothetical protein
VFNAAACVPRQASAGSHFAWVVSSHHHTRVLFRAWFAGQAASAGDGCGALQLRARAGNALQHEKLAARLAGLRAKFSLGADIEQDANNIVAIGRDEIVAGA